MTSSRSSGGGGISSGGGTNGGFSRRHLGGRVEGSRLWIIKRALDGFADVWWGVTNPVVALFKSFTFSLAVPFCQELTVSSR